MFKGIPEEQYSQYIAIITEEQATELAGQEATYYLLFNPVMLNGNWTITMQEIIACVNDKFMWVKDLPLIPYVPAE